MIGETNENIVSNADNVKVSSMAFVESLWKDTCLMMHWVDLLESCVLHGPGLLLVVCEKRDRDDVTLVCLEQIAPFAFDHIALQTCSSSRWITL